MTNKQIEDLLKHEAKNACSENGIKVAIKYMTLLESGHTNGMFDYIMFEDRKTGRQYQCGKSWSNYTEKHPTPWNVEQYC